MAAEAHFLEIAQVRRPPRSRRLLLIWQNPKTRSFVRVGELAHLVDGRYSFRYLATASSDPDFFALDEYPFVDRAYVSDSLPAFFANRVMSSGRESYKDYIGWLGLDATPVAPPMEVLARTGGGKATDTFHVVEVPGEGSDEGVWCRFFASGVRHVATASDVLGRLAPGMELQLEGDALNAVNPHALLLTNDGQSVGWVPDWLIQDLHNTEDVRVHVEKVNPSAPAHLRLLCVIRKS
jgi:hypothetical protein